MSDETFRPSDVFFSNEPLPGMFGYSDAEAAAALLVRAMWKDAPLDFPRMREANTWEPIMLSAVVHSINEDRTQRRAPFCEWQRYELDRGFTLLGVHHFIEVSEDGEPIVAFTSFALDKLRAYAAQFKNAVEAS